MAEFQKPEGWRFSFGGVNLRNQPDAIPPGKYSCAVNIRATSDQSIKTRPGFVSVFASGNNNAITDMRTYAALGTDDAPRILARDTQNRIILDSGATVATLAGNTDLGVCMLPFRPGASPQTWMYVAGRSDYQKVSAPSNNNSVTAFKVGIAEPQFPLDAATNAVSFSQIASNNTGTWTAGGTAGGLSSGNLISDTVGTPVINDPVVSTRQSLPVSIPYYATGMLPSFSGAGPQTVEEVWPACGNCSVSAITYDAGNTGLCWVVPSVDISDSIGRGALLTITSETTLVLGVVKGTNGTCAFRCSTASTHAASEAIVGVRAIVVHGSVSPAATITYPLINTSVSSGIGTVSRALPAGAFSVYSQDDYFHISFLLNNIAVVTSLSIIFDISGTTPDYKTSILTYSVTGASLSPQLLAGEVVEIHFPLSALGGSLNACGGIQIQLVTSGTCSMDFGGLWVGGGSGPDIGETGAAYQYEAKLRSSLTGAQGNPSPSMRYGVSPRRQSVLVKTSAISNGGDSQIDTVDVYRYGGSLTTYRYLGTVPYGQDFTDTYFDDTAIAGAQISETDFEPWPSIGLPFKSTGTIAVVGTIITVTDASVAWPSTILRWLPGTLLQIGGQQTFTLAARPIQLSATSYLFNIQECAGHIAAANSFYVTEPVVARQFVPYMDGPDANGVFFAVGDPLRPGGVYWAQAYAPDSAPQTNYLELSSPSEPLLKPFVLQTITLVASTSRWWALYPSFTQAQQYTQIEQPVGRGLISPYGCCTDKQQVYFWAKDGICATNGGAAASLTDADLYDLFPHEGVAGQGVQGSSIVRAGITWYAPDYSRAAQFRLSYANKALFADYLDKNGSQRTLVCDLRTGAWSQDIYGAGAIAITSHYAPEQQAGSLIASGTLYPAMLLSDSLGNVHKEQNYANDAGTSIACTVATFEWDGGDRRAQPNFGDAYLECLPLSAVTVTPMSLGAAAATASVISAGSARKLLPVSVGGILTVKYLGLMLQWTDNFSSVSAATELYLWQFSIVAQPVIETDRIHDWIGGQGAQYFRGFTLSADTFGANKSIVIRDSDANSSRGFIGGPANNSINFSRQQEKAFSFPVPFVSHYARLEPQDTVPWRYFGAPFGPGLRWIAEPWPELNQDDSPWMNLGFVGSKYMRGAVVPMDTNGASVTLTLTSSDGGTPVSMGPFTTTAAVKTPVPLALAVPLIGHEYQIAKSGPCRIWWEEIRWDFDQWPELISEATPWMNLGTEGAKYLRSVVIPIDTGGSPVTFTFVSSDGGSVSIGPLTTTASERSPTPWPFSVPLIGHGFQIRPSSPCRIWFSEAKWTFEPVPELIKDSSPWMNLGFVGAKYMRGALIPMDTNGSPVTLTLLSSDGGNPVTMGPFLTTAGSKTMVPLALAVPLIGHEFQIAKSGPCRIWWEETQWEFDKLPELVVDSSPWMNLGFVGSKYMRGAVVPMDTNGASVTLTLISTDGGNTSIGPFSTVAGSKTPVPLALAVPLIGHEYQIAKSGPCRIWWEEIRWDFDQWPELISEATGWLKIFGDSSAAFLQGLLVPVEAAGATPLLSLITDASATPINLISPVTPISSFKTSVPYSLPVPVVCHEAQIIPSAPCRVWLQEIKWIAQKTPDIGATWITQASALGQQGYMSIPRIEAAWSATAEVTLTITAFDGTSPAVLTLPSTGGKYHKEHLTLTPNKGTLYQFSAVSASPFQMFLNDWVVSVCPWGRSGPEVPFRNLGSQFGDKAEI